MKGLAACGWFLFVLAPFWVIGCFLLVIFHFGFGAPRFACTIVFWGPMLVGVFAGAHVASAVLRTKDPNRMRDGQTNDNESRDVSRGSGDSV